MGETLWVGRDVPVSSIAVSSRAPALLPLTLQVDQLFLNGLHLVLQVVQIQLQFGNLLGLGLVAPPEAAFARASAATGASTVAALTTTTASGRAPVGSLHHDPLLTPRSLRLAPEPARVRDYSPRCHGRMKILGAVARELHRERDRVRAGGVRGPADSRAAACQSPCLPCRCYGERALKRGQFPSSGHGIQQERTGLGPGHSACVSQSGKPIPERRVRQ